MKKKSKSKLFWRWLIYLTGLLILAFGIILNTKSAMGVSPIISVAYSVSVIRHLNFGNASLGMYVVLAIAEYLLKGRSFRLYDLLQIPLVVGFTRLFNLYGALLPNPEVLPARILCLVVGIICTGIGACMSMNARLVPNPGDGIVQAISDRVHRKVGICKNCFDIGCVTVTVIIGMYFTGHTVGIGVGTVCAMIFVGRVMAVYNALFGQKAAALTGVPFINGRQKSAAAASAEGSAAE